MDIRIYNTLSGKKELLKTIEPQHVKLYVCGITSYDFCHIGHARSSLAFDMIVRYLRYCQYKVTYVRNFTDVDDKIIARANEKGIPSSELANNFINEFHTDMDALGILRPDIEPKATEHINDMIDIIQELIDKDMAYASGGDVYYVVDSFPEYGKLSRRNIEDMKAGARISVNEQKRHPMDFVLWKAAKEGEPSWESPWGAGRPGWHIECSAMSRKYLGANFDIHGGGKDLVFPHHENEIAQSEGANGESFANTWIHHGFVTINNEKMSKSLHNFLTIRDILKEVHPETLRTFIFSTQYRNPVDFSDTALQEAETALVRLYECLLLLQQKPEIAKDAESRISDKDRNKLTSIEERFQKAMNNDFNTAQSLGIFFDSVKIINRLYRAIAKGAAQADYDLLLASMEKIKELSEILGTLQQDPQDFIDQRNAKKLEGIDITLEEIEQYIQERIDARTNKDWARSDEIRDLLLEKKIALKDGADGTSWDVLQ